MGERNTSCHAIILTIQEQGENNRRVTVLSPENGIFSAVLYGGGKSRLKSLVQPFYSGILYIYNDESRKSIKITDFDVTSSHLSFRQNLYKIWAANLAAEIVLKSKAGGEDSKAFVLLSAFLDGIDAVDEKESRLGTLRFLWRYLNLLGIQPDICNCVQCSVTLDGQQTAYIDSFNGFLCNECVPYAQENFTEGKFIIGKQSTDYLKALNDLRPSEVRQLTLSAQSVYELKSLLFHLIENALGCRLKTLESGMGIL